MKKEKNKIWEGVTFQVRQVCPAAGSQTSMWKFGVEEWKVAFVDREFSGTGGF